MPSITAEPQQRSRLNRRHVMLLGASVAIGLSMRRADAAPLATPGAPARLITGLLNFKDEVPQHRADEIVAEMREAAADSGAAGFMARRNLSTQMFATRFEWMYMIEYREPQARLARAASRFSDEHAGWRSYFRDEVTCEVSCPLPAGFARGSGVTVRHVVMFDFKPDAAAQARERIVAAIRRMGDLPAVQRYLVQPCASRAADPSRLQWQVVGDFASRADFKAYLDAPQHLAMRDDFTVHTSRVAFIDVAL